MERAGVCFDLLESVFPDTFISLRGQHDVHVGPLFLEC
jgi:hypothetical protein